jgi:hypothetical protein
MHPCSNEGTFHGGGTKARSGSPTSAAVQFAFFIVPLFHLRNRRSTEQGGNLIDNAFLKPAVDDDIQAMAGNSAVRCLCFGFRPHSGTSPFSRMANASGSLPIQERLDLANSRTWPLAAATRDWF